MSDEMNFRSVNNIEQINIISPINLTHITILIQKNVIQIAYVNETRNFHRYCFIFKGFFRTFCFYHLIILF